MTQEQKDIIQIEINQSFDRLINGVTHPHIERKKLLDKIINTINL